MDCLSRRPQRRPFPVAGASHRTRWAMRRDAIGRAFLKASDYHLSLKSQLIGA
jgi:hypothetical protein